MRDPRLARLAAQIHRLRRETRTQARASQAAYRGVEVSDGAVPYYDDDGTIRLQIGQQEDGTFTVVENNPDAPPVPTSPTLEERPGAIAIIHDGTFVDANTPLDFAYFEIHASQEPDYFADDTTQIGSFASPQGGIFVFAASSDDAPWYISVQAVNRSGVESDKSAEVMGSALPMGGGNVSTPTEPPASSPGVSVSSGSRSLTIYAQAEPDIWDTLLYEVALDAAFTDVYTTVTTRQTVVQINPTPDRTDLWVRATQFNDVGSAPPGPASGPIRTALIEDVDVSDLALTVRKFRTATHFLY